MFRSLVDVVCANGMSVFVTAFGAGAGAFSEYAYGHMQDCDTSSRLITTAFFTAGVVGVVLSVCNKKLRRDYYNSAEDDAKKHVCYTIESGMYNLALYSGGLSIGSGFTSITEEELVDCSAKKVYAFVILGITSSFILLNAINRVSMHKRISYKNQIRPISLPTAPPITDISGSTDGIELVFTKQHPGQPEVRDWC